jgi:hypothetical protein
MQPQTLTLVIGPHHLPPPAFQPLTATLAAYQPNKSFCSTSKLHRSIIFTR